jgi:hypothetical protein
MNHNIREYKNDQDYHIYRCGESSAAASSVCSHYSKEIKNHGCLQKIAFHATNGDQLALEKDDDQ